MKSIKWKEVLTSNQMFIIYIIAVLSLAIGMKNSAFFDFSTVITLSRALLVTLCFAICEMVVIISGSCMCGALYPGKGYEGCRY